jgi:hypothetical protein
LLQNAIITFDQGAAIEQASDHWMDYFAGRFGALAVRIFFGRLSANDKLARLYAMVDCRLLAEH